MAEARGLWYFDETSNIFSVFDGMVYKDENSFISLTTNTGKVGFSEAIYGLKQYLFLADGKKGYLIDKDDPTSFQMIDDSHVITITVTSGGSDYVTPPDVTIDPPNIAAWLADTAYALGALVINDSNVYICVSAGTSASSGGPTGTDNLITDNTCGWRYVLSEEAATATASCELADGAVVYITLITPGYGYSGAPTVTFSEGEATAIATLSGFPIEHIPTPVFLDGYLFLAKAGTPDIYNSGIGDYDYWNPIDYVTVSQYSDEVLGLAKQNNQIMALKEDSTEYLYDAANAFGSPLAKTNQAVIQIGCASTYSIDDHERKVFFIGKSSTGTVGVWAIEGFKEQKVSTEAVDRLLQNEGTFISLAYAYAIRTEGHFFYVIRLYGGRTVVYDVEEQFWHEWSSVNNGIEGNFFGKFATAIGTLPVVQHATNGKIYNVDTTAYEDATGPIKVLWTSIPVDMENTYRKWFQSLTFVGDQQTSISNLTVKYSDDDYKTWSNGWTINLQERAYIKRLGSARRRAFKLEHEANTPFRMEALEIVYSQSEH